jgi:hypothetical protein
MTVDKQLKQIRIIFFAILLGLLMFCAGAIVLVSVRGVLMPLAPTQTQYIETLIIILAFVGIPSAHFFHKKKTEHINPQWDLLSKLSRYRVSFFIKMATFEGISLVSLLTYVMSGNNTFLIIFVILVIAILINYPTKSRIFEELGVDETDILE